jgi:hypothetical protein
MTITAHTPKWTNAEHTAIELIVQFPWIEGEVPFTATLNDTDYATELFNRASSSEFGPIEEYIVSAEHNRLQLTQEAKAYLTSTDWYITRKMETNKDIPTDVALKREEARTVLNSLN